MAWLISLVFIVYLVVLFWHSNDVFIRAHMETIEKFKKSLFRIMNMSLTLIPAVKTLLFGASIDIHDAVRYI